MKVYWLGLLSGKYLPNKHAYKSVPGGQNISPAIQWGDVPQGTKSFAFSIVDHTAGASNMIHWFVVNVPHSVREIPERASGTRDKMPPGALEIRNSFGELGYGGPNLPRNSGPHEYVLAVYALNVENLSRGPFSTSEECEREMRGKVIASATVSGIFRR